MMMFIYSRHKMLCANLRLNLAPAWVSQVILKEDLEQREVILRNTLNNALNDDVYYFPRHKMLCTNLPLNIAPAWGRESPCRFQHFYLMNNNFLIVVGLLHVF